MEVMTEMKDEKESVDKLKENQEQSRETLKLPGPRDKWLEAVASIIPGVIGAVVLIYIYDVFWVHSRFPWPLPFKIQLLII